MIQIKALMPDLSHDERMWKSIASAPFGYSLELAVSDEDGLHALVFPCLKAREGWKHAKTGARVDIRPTHWRHWGDENDECAPASERA